MVKKLILVSWNKIKIFKNAPNHNLPCLFQGTTSKFEDFGSVWGVSETTLFQRITFMCGAVGHSVKKPELGDFGDHFEHDLNEKNSNKSLDKKKEYCKKFLALFHVCALYDGSHNFCFWRLLYSKFWTHLGIDFNLICILAVQYFAPVKSSKCSKIATFRF